MKRAACVVVVKRALAVALAASLGACGGATTGTPELLGIEGRDRETLDATYPTGTPRATIRAREGEALVFSVNPCNFGVIADDPGLTRAVEAFREEHPGVTPTCDRVRLARTGWVTVVGGLAYYQDYVFYDADDQVLESYRTFLQRSGD